MKAKNTITVKLTGDLAKQFLNVIPKLYTIDNFALRKAKTGLIVSGSVESWTQLVSDVVKVCR